MANARPSNCTDMDNYARILAIHVAADAEELPRAVGRVRVLPGRGLEGDRYATGRGTFSDNPKPRDVSLIESEALTAFAEETGVQLSAAESRRNILTKGVRLNELVGHEFSIGQIRLRGLRLCEPCTHLARLTIPEALHGLVHRGGLYASILCEGEIAVGDAIVCASAPHAFAEAIDAARSSP